jgi:hypothetical protein
MKVDNFDAAMVSIGTKATYTGATTTTVGWILSSEFGVLAGVMIGVLGLLTNWWFQHRRDMREQADFARRERLEELEHQRRMDKLRTKPGDLL